MLYLLWDTAFFLTQGHILIGLAIAVLPITWFWLAWRSRHPHAPDPPAGSHE